MSKKIKLYWCLINLRSLSIRRRKTTQIMQEVEAIGFQYEKYIYLLKTFNLFTPILIFIGYYLYIFFQVKFSLFLLYLLLLFSIILQDCPCIIGLRLWQGQWFVWYGGVTGVKDFVKTVSTKKKRWDLGTGNSLLRGQKTPYANWTYLLGKSAASLGSRLKT